MTDHIVSILNTLFGEYSKESNGWYSYNCPCCADMNGGVPDDKYNLEISIDPDVKGCGGFHCWKCGDTDNMRGSLTHLIRKYGGRSVYEDFARYVKEYRKSRLYELSTEKSDLLTEMDDLETVSLPVGCKAIEKGTEAYEYLSGRGVTDNIIKEYGLLMIDDTVKNKQYRNRIVIPSYDRYDTLNYWVGRDYTGQSQRKVVNAKKPKTEIVFNEGMINWYEPITLVEGPFDHIVTPNSIPLLGKSLDETYVLYDTLYDKARSDIRIFLDDDAIKSAYRIYKVLDKGRLKGSIQIIETPDGYDPSLIFQEYGCSGILDLLCTARRINDFELI